MKKNKIIGLSLGLFLFGIGPLAAQVTDSTSQNQQLQTLPGAPAKAEPVKSPPRPVVTDSIPKVGPPPSPGGDPDQPVVSNRRVITQEKPDWRSKLFIGGGADLGFSSSPYYGSYFHTGLSPVLGYRVTKNLAFGPGLVYQFTRFGGVSFNDYGGKLFGQFIVYKMFFLHAEQEFLNIQNYTTDSQGMIIDTYRSNVVSTLGGAGYRQMANDRLGFDLFVLFRLGSSANYEVDNSRPIIRGGLIYNLYK